MLCPYCKYKISGKRHQDTCPYNPKNTKRIVDFLLYYVVHQSKYNEGFKPFPTSRELDAFLKANKISRVKTLSRYLTDELTLQDWLIEMLDYALNTGIVDRLTFPWFLLYVYDAWLFYTPAEYRQLYEQSIVYEDGDTLDYELDGGQRSSVVRHLRTVGTPFLESEKVTLTEVLT